MFLSFQASNFDLVSMQEVPSCRLVPLPRQRAYPHHAVGIDDQVNRVIQLLEWENETKAAVAVILHGLGGTGKTTLADAVVARLDIQGWNGYTVEPSAGLVPVINYEDVQQEIQDMFGKELQAFIYIDNVTVGGNQLHKLLPNNSCNKKFRLLLTARDEMVADVLKECGIDAHVYPLKPLLPQDAMELLCKKMGVSGTMQTPQINEILKICDGVPLVLERVGAYIRQEKDEAYRRVIEWSKDGRPFSSAEEYSIEKKGLLFDLDELPASTKETFLDICSFFNGWDWDRISCIMGANELNNLRKRAMLLNKDECENKATVPNIILTIGLNTTKGKRFTSVHDLSKALEGNELGIRGIKGIWLQNNRSEPFIISARKLDLMQNSLRVLALGDMAIVVDRQCHAQEFKHLIYFQAGLIPYIPFHPATPQELRLLDWLPDHNINDLQLIKMSSKLKVMALNGGRYDRRCVTASVFERLRGLSTLNLAEFKTLKILPPQLLLLTQLEELDLSGCENLVELPKGLGNLNALTKLSFRSCSSLPELPDSFGKLRSLKYLDLHSCITLKQLPEDFGSLSSLEELDLGSGYLEELPSSFGKLSSLKVLNLMHCGSLTQLPPNIGNLSALVTIEFEGSHLLGIPPSFQCLNSFPLSVSMAHCSFLTDLPEEFCIYLKLVKELSFRCCQLLTKLPNRFVELASLRRLDLHYCRSLERLPEGFGQLKSLTELNLKECHSLQELSSDFHCLASLQTLNMQWCMMLEGKWMNIVGKIKTLYLVDIVGSHMLLKRWAEMEMEMENGEEPWHFAVRTGRKKWKIVENILNKAASKLFTGEWLLKDSRGEQFCLSTVEPNTVLLVTYEHDQDPWGGPWRLLEEVVSHEHPFQVIYVGNCFGEFSKSFRDRIMAHVSEDSDARLLFYKVLEVHEDDSAHLLSNFLVTEVVADEKGSKHLSTWKDISHSCVEFLLSKSKLYSHLQKLTKTPQETNVKLLSALFDNVESRKSSIFLRKYTEKIGVDQLHGKTVLLLISIMDEHPFQSLTEIYLKAKTNDDLEILSIPIPVDVRGKPQRRLPDDLAVIPDSDLAGFENILRNVPWPVLQNPWLLKTEVYCFIEKEWGELNPGILVVVNPNGRICHKNALPLVKTWGAEVYPFAEEKMKQLETKPIEELMSEPILDALFQKWSN